MVLVYAHLNSPRLEYTLQLVFRDILGSAVEITHDLSAFRASSYPKICYHEQPAGDGLFLKAGSFLFETGLAYPDLQPVDAEGETGFFPTSADSFLPFDPFASTFLMVSRMEEYPPGPRDHHGRFPSCESILYRHGLLEKAVVNRWARLTAVKMEAYYGKKLFPPARFSFLSTIDVDNAWAYRHKGFFRTAGAALKELLKGDFSGLMERTGRICGREKATTYTYDYLQDKSRGNEHMVSFFFLLGDYGKFDKAVSWKNRCFRDLISGISLQYRVGIHPSYRSGLSRSPDLLTREKRRLEKIINQPVNTSRQHYLLLNFPETYRKLLQSGISEDYSLGYSEHPGFRAGICTPFYFYDLAAEQTTPLRIFPFQVMDVTLAQYMQLSPDQAILKIRELMDEVFAVGGLFCSIWHNESLSDKGIWNGYREVFEKMNETGFRYAEGK